MVALGARDMQGGETLHVGQWLAPVVLEELDERLVLLRHQRRVDGCVLDAGLGQVTQVPTSVSKQQNNNDI